MNPWLAFLKSYRVKNKGVSMKDSMKKAAVLWRAQKKGSTEKKKPKRRVRKV